MYEAIITKKRGGHRDSGKLSAATQLEVQAAVAGKLSPRKHRGNDGQTDLVRIGHNGMPVGRPIGVTTGLPIYLAICFIFQQNEKAPKSKKLTDSRISEWLRHEFPGRATGMWDRVQEMRRHYNAGKFTRGFQPKHPSHRYDSGGEVTDPSYGNGKERKTSPQD